MKERLELRFRQIHMDFHTPLDTLETLDPGKIVRCVEEGVRLTEVIAKR